MEWQDISSAPRDGTRILVYIPPRYRGDTNWAVSDCWMDKYDLTWETPCENDVNPTHWMPLPNPPEANQ